MEHAVLHVPDISRLSREDVLCLALHPVRTREATELCKAARGQREDGGSLQPHCHHPSIFRQRFCGALFSSKSQKKCLRRDNLRSAILSFLKPVLSLCCQLKYLLRRPREGWAAAKLQGDTVKWPAAPGADLVSPKSVMASPAVPIKTQ